MNASKHDQRIRVRVALPALTAFVLACDDGAFEAGVSEEWISDAEHDRTAASGVFVMSEPTARASGGGQGETCLGSSLPACPTSTTGPSCSYSCDTGAVCSFRYYCHGDGRIAGMAVSRSRLLSLSPTSSATTAANALEAWATTHEFDLGFPNGLTTTALQFAPAANSKVTQGGLSLYRLRQYYRASSSLPSVPVVAEAGLLTVEANSSGVVSFKGTIIDPRRSYAFSSAQASSATATNSIKLHASARSGIPQAQITVTALRRVAVPSIEQIAWYGIATAGLGPIGRVTVSANPALQILPIIDYDGQPAESLDQTVQILVRAQDGAEDPFLEPFAEADEVQLFDGSPLLGSLDDLSGETQLADGRVVTVDIEGNEISDVMNGTEFSRFTSPIDVFDASQPDAQFYAQRDHFLLRNSFAILDQVAVGKWDSAIQLFDSMLTSAFAPGTFRPRMIALFNHASTGNAAAASQIWFGNAQVPVALAAFPELVHRPQAAAQHEVVGSLQLQGGVLDVEVLLHEFGHNVDYFLAPGISRDYAPPCVGACDSTCDEDTSDESYPLDETVAQMVSMWMLMRNFPDLPHGTCDLMARYISGGTENQANVHSPECLDATDQIGLFIRNDDPSCTDLTICDKPYRAATDPNYGAPNNCRTTDGYNAFSILQVWWNTLHGLYCDPTSPFECHDYAPSWPLGCGPGGPVQCVSADETAGLALAYALRTNPLSYVEFFDAMTRFVACNYGEDAYLIFNQALCDHEIRACNEPFPLVCEACGNGIREGGENCDGSDLSVDEVGVIPECSDFPGYIGGTLACNAACEYDFSGCESVGADVTGGGSQSRAIASKLNGFRSVAT